MAFEKVLIVEDDELIRNLLTQTFARRNYVCIEAANLAEAELAISRDSFDLVMLDIKLPDGNGQVFLDFLSISKTCKKNYEYQNVTLLYLRLPRAVLVAFLSWFIYSIIFTNVYYPTSGVKPQ